MKTPRRGCAGGRTKGCERGLEVLLASHDNTRREDLQVVFKRLSREDRMDILESAITDIDRAMSALDEDAHYREHTYDLAGIANDLQDMLDQLREEEEAEHKQIMASMTRDYWRSVL